MSSPPPTALIAVFRRISTEPPAAPPPANGGLLPAENGLEMHGFEELEITAPELPPEPAEEDILALLAEQPEVIRLSDVDVPVIEEARQRAPATQARPEPAPQSDPKADNPRSRRLATLRLNPLPSPRHALMSRFSRRPVVFAQEATRRAEVEPEPEPQRELEPGYDEAELELEIQPPASGFAALSPDPSPSHPQTRGLESEPAGQRYGHPGIARLAPESEPPPQTAAAPAYDPDLALRGPSPRQPLDELTRPGSPSDVHAEAASLPKPAMDRVGRGAPPRNRRLYRRVRLGAEIEINGTPCALIDISIAGFAATGAPDIPPNTVVPAILRFNIDGIAVGTELSARIVYVTHQRASGRFIELTASQTAFLRYIVTWRGESVGTVGTTTLLDAITGGPDHDFPPGSADAPKERWWYGMIGRNARPSR